MASGCSRWPPFRPARSALSLPTYLQFALGGGNTRARLEPGIARDGRNQFIGSLEYTYVAPTGSRILRRRPEPVCGAAARGVRGPGLARHGDSDLTGSRPSTAMASGCGSWCRLWTDPAGRGLGRAGTGRQRLFRRVAQGGAPAPACAVSLAHAGVPSCGYSRLRQVVTCCAVRPRLWRCVLAMVAVVQPWLGYCLSLTPWSAGLASSGD